MSQPVIAVFGASRIDSDGDEYTQAILCGRMLGEAGYAVATGGYAGVMEAVSRGAREAATTTIGVTTPTVFPDRPGANSFVSDERPTDSLMERIHEITRISAGAIALPGSIGTLTELMAAWNIAYVARFTGEPPKPLITVGDTWARFVADVATSLDTDGGLVVCVDDVPAAVAEIRSRVPV